MARAKVDWDEFIGYQFGNSKMLSWKRKNGRVYATFECKCGKKYERLIDNVKKTGKASCNTCQYSSYRKLSEHVGDRLGSLTITARVSDDKDKNVLYEVTCDCGNKEVYKYSALRVLKDRRCRKCRGVKAYIKAEDVVGKKFHHLTVLRLSDKTSPRERHMCVVRCDCGRTKEVRVTSITSGASKSCGLCQYSKRSTHRKEDASSELDRGLETGVSEEVKS